MSASQSVGVAVKPGNIQQLLFVLRGADLQSTADQAFTKSGSFTNYVPARLLCVCKTGGAIIACAGGIYTGAAKAGDQIVAVAQSWVTASAVGAAVDAAIANLLTTKQSSATPNLSLTTGSTAAATADFFIFGNIV